MADFNTPRVSEKRYYSIPNQLFTANGTTNGIITIASTYGFKVGQMVSLSSATQSPRRLKIKRIISETQFHVGEDKTRIWEYEDISSFLVSESAVVSLVEQERPVIHLNEIQRQVYEEEPTVAIRTHSVDYLGRSYSVDNPIPTKIVDGAINIGAVNVDLTHKDNFPNIGDVADSVRLGDGQNLITATTSGTKTALDVNVLNKLVDVPHDSIYITSKNSDGDPTTIVFKKSGTQVLSLTLVYDADGDLESVEAN